MLPAFIVTMAIPSSAASHVCSCYTCGSSLRRHDNELSNAYRACETGACSTKHDDGACESSGGIVGDICDCQSRKSLPTVHCERDSDRKISWCKGQAAVCSNSPIAPLCASEESAAAARRAGSTYPFFTFSPTQDRHVSYWLHRTHGFYDFHQHWVLDYARRELAFLNRAVPSSRRALPLVLDVGSNLGTLTLYALSTGCCHVHAFELQREVVSLLRRSIATVQKQAATASGKARAVLHHVAVSEVAGTNVTYTSQPSNPGGVSLRPLPPGVGAGASDTVVVPTVNLDELFIGPAQLLVGPPPPTVLMMKVDVRHPLHPAVLIYQPVGPRPPCCVCAFVSVLA